MNKKTILKHSSAAPVIGVVGGMGPMAGFDLARKICANTIAAGDQDHIPVLLYSLPSTIPDRTEFLLGHEKTNPACAIAEILTALEKAGAETAGIPCNTAHARPIMEKTLQILKAGKRRIRIIHIIEETYNFILKKKRNISKAGILATRGALKTGVYQTFFEAGGIQTVIPDEETQEKIHSAIYDPAKGVKAVPETKNRFALDIFTDAIDKLNKAGAQAIVLGCTEIPLVINAGHISNAHVFDPTEILARALIRETYPEKLKQTEFYDTEN